MSTLPLLMTGLLLLAPLAAGPKETPLDAEAILRGVEELDHARQQQWLKRLETRLTRANSVLLKPAEAEKKTAEHVAVLHRKEISRDDLEKLLREADRREQGAIAQLTREYRVQVYETFWKEQEAYVHRQAALTRVLAAWEASGKPFDEQEKMVVWLKAALESVTAKNPLPEDPAFATEESAPPPKKAPEAGKTPAATQPADRKDDASRPPASESSAGVHLVPEKLAAIAPVEALPAPEPPPVTVLRGELGGRVAQQRHAAPEAIVETAISLPDTLPPTSGRCERSNACGDRDVDDVPTIGLRVTLRATSNAPAAYLEALAGVAEAMPAPTVAAHTVSTEAPSGAQAPAPVFAVEHRRWEDALPAADASVGKGGRLPDVADEPAVELAPAVASSRPVAGDATGDVVLPAGAAPPGGPPRARAALADDIAVPPAEVAEELPPPVEVNVADLRARIAGYNLALRAVEADLDAGHVWDAARLSPLLEKLKDLVEQRGNLDAFRALVPEPQRAALGRCDATQPILAQFARRTAEARARVSGPDYAGKPAERRAEISRLDALARTLAEWLRKQ